jgi:putative glutamine amidotransferase
MLGKRTLKIGISARFYHPRPDSSGIERRTLQYLEQSVAHWVMSRDVLVFMVPSVDAEGIIHRGNIRLSDYAQHLDGLVLQGGADIAPKTYGEDALRPDWDGDRVRDAYEMELLHEFVESGKPVLGLCRGAQLINVAFGGNLYQDIQQQFAGAIEHANKETYDSHAHAITLEPGSALAQLYPGQTQVRVNSIHHQAIRTLGRDLVVEAWSEPDRVIEAIRKTGRNYVFGVQWHPEFIRPGDADLLDPTPILDDFLNAVRKRS